MIGRSPVDHGAGALDGALAPPGGARGGGGEADDVLAVAILAKATCVSVAVKRAAIRARCRLRMLRLVKFFSPRNEKGAGRDLLALLGAVDHRSALPFWERHQGIDLHALVEAGPRDPHRIITKGLASACVALNSALAPPGRPRGGGGEADDVVGTFANLATVSATACPAFGARPRLRMLRLVKFFSPRDEKSALRVAYVAADQLPSFRTSAST